MEHCGGACAQGLDFEFTMAFQPVIDAPTKTIYAHEALVRGPQGESAFSILSRVNDTNRYAFDQACRTRAIEMAASLGMDCRLNINFLPNAVYHPEACLRATLAAAERVGFQLDRITFEFTENERVMDRDHLRSIVETYRRYGFSSALDDFGSGYAGLTLLADFRPNIVKIDRALVMGINDDPVRVAIVQGILLTCEKLGIAVVAEGVETIEEYNALRELGVNRFQGFLFARPRLNALVSADEIAFPA